MEKQVEFQDEPIILPFRRDERPEPPPDDANSDRAYRLSDNRSETFWAGRNLAMRVSARWAA